MTGSPDFGHVTIAAPIAHEMYVKVVLIERLSGSELSESSRATIQGAAQRVLDLFVPAMAQLLKGGGDDLPHHPSAGGG